MAPIVVGVPRTVTDTRTRLLEATYDCIARDGLGATSLEDAARSAGVSRATLYRYFPGGREELLGAVITWETLRFFLRLADAVRAQDQRLPVVYAPSWEELRQVVGSMLRPGDLCLTLGAGDLTALPDELLESPRW